MSTTHVLPESRTIQIERTIHVIACAHCTINFGIGAEFMKRRREDHGAFYCPNGHSNVYRGDNTEAKLRKDLERIERQRDAAREDRDWQRERRLAAERQRAAARGQVTKIKNRVSKGVCPCCNRTFENLARHVEGQHPEYAGGAK